MRMKPKNRKNKFTKQECDRIKDPGTYFFNDAAGIALRVSKNKIKSVYASYSVPIGITDDGKIKRQGKYKFICRLGQQPIEQIKTYVNANIAKWKKSPLAGNKSAPDVGSLVTDFLRPGAAKYRVKKSGNKLEYKQKTKTSYAAVLEPLVLHKTDDPMILDRLTSKVMINGSYNTDILKDIKLNKLTKDHVKNHHERLAATPAAANRFLSALSAAFTWDMNRGGSKLWQQDYNPCYGIPKFAENKDKKYLKIEKVLEIMDYIKSNLFRDPHFLTYYMLLLDIGERQSDVMGLTWREPHTESEKLKCSGWLNNTNTKVYIRDSKDRNSAEVDLTPDATAVVNKLMDLKASADNAASFAAASPYVFPRPSDIKNFISENSYRKKLEKFHYKFGLAERSLVRSFGSRKLYKYKHHYTFKHLRKTFATHYGAKYGLMETSERLRHSSPKVTEDHYYNAAKDKFKGRSAYDVGENVVKFKEAK